MRKINKKITNNDENKIITNDSSWLDEELEDCKLPDERLRKRFFKLIKQLWTGIGQPIPFACEDWSNTKAAYRFFSNERLTEHEILQGHFSSTAKRFSKTTDVALVLHDTTEFSYKRADQEQIGITKLVPCGKDIYGKAKLYTKCGILMHSSLVVTPEGLPLGLSSIKFWTRKQFKGTSALKNHVNPTRISIEKKESYRWLTNIKATNSLLDAPERCVHIGDRESDIFELFCQTQELKTHFLVRTCVDRLAGDGNHTIATEMEDVKSKGLHTVDWTLDIQYPKFELPK